ncbi:MAG TPA: ABC transporter substrate-binding protein [Candidatus Acidoferrum sp.]|nr:ABC transporter substrate-binding protein [Candidatus Acidoferrum sp.]
MKSIESRWLAGCRRLAALATIFVVASSAPATTKPRTGGVLRVELLANSATLDPRTWKTGSREFATNERLAALVFDRLVALDNYGRFAAQLATEWTHDATYHRWQFAIRGDVKFSDGAALTAADAAAALAPLLSEDLKVSAAGNNVVFQSTEQRPDLLEILASGRYFIYRASPEGALLGTGPFTVGEAAAQHFRFSANETCWAGRPFLDAIDVILGVPPLRALFDLQAGKAELAELAPDIARRATQSNTRVWASLPLTLYALRFDEAQPQTANEALRESLALSLDRATMAGVLLQRQGEPAAALLPQWLSGYAFLFRAELDLERAKQLRASLPANVAGGTSPLRVQAQASGDLARLLAERVAVNARQAGLSVQPLLKTGAREGTVRAGDGADLHLFAWRYTSLSPGEELREFAKAEQAPETKESNPADPDRRYAWERKILEERKLIPLVALPDYAGLAPTVRDWQPSAWGEWRLADVWLEPAGSQAGATRNPPSAVTTTPGARP